jgi:hypothetical protein
LYVVPWGLRKLVNWIHVVIFFPHFFPSSPHSPPLLYYHFPPSPPLLCYHFPPSLPPSPTFNLPQRYGEPDIIVTENGVDAPGENELPIKEALNDTFRVSYYRDYLQELSAAIYEDNVDVVGRY